MHRCLQPRCRRTKVHGTKDGCGGFLKGCDEFFVHHGATTTMHRKTDASIAHASSVLFPSIVWLLLLTFCQQTSNATSDMQNNPSAETCVARDAAVNHLPCCFCGRQSSLFAGFSFCHLIFQVPCFFCGTDRVHMKCNTFVAEHVGPPHDPGKPPF